MTKTKPEKTYKRKLFKKRKLEAGVMVQKIPKGVEANIQLSIVKQMDDSFNIE